MPHHLRTDPALHRRITQRDQRWTISGWRGLGRGVVMMALLALTVSGCASGEASEAAPSPSETAALDFSGDTPEQQEEESAETDESTSDEGDSDEADADTESVAPSTSAEGQEDAEGPQEDAPVSFEIPAIDAGSELLHLGLRDNGSLDVPPHDPGSPASWYTGSPVPGETGPSVLLGHVDHAGGTEPGVFADLPALVEGDEIIVTAENGDTATFVVTKAEQYGKNTFPTLEVYGNTEESELRLITCDGYNPESGEYEDNYVVYATLAD